MNDATRRERLVDAGLSTLLVLQGLTLFLAIPLGGRSAAGRMLLDGCHLAFAAICVGVLVRHRIIQAGVVAALLLLLGGPPLMNRLGADLHLQVFARHEAIAVVAFAFNGGVTALVARHVFAPGRVTVHRVRGAILLYLNVAALFAIAYSFIAMAIPDAFRWPTSDGPGPLAAHTADFTYFSLTTITTTGYGDVAPVHPLARSLANLEAVFGQLFPATLLARLVSQNVRHEGPKD
jgi:hypothetical protein